MNKEPFLPNEDTYKVLFDNAPDGVILIDTNSEILFWNQKSEAIFGWNAGEVTGKDLTKFIIPETWRQAHNGGMSRFLKTGISTVLNKTIEVPAVGKNGTEFYISLTISQTSHLGKIAFLAFIRDITEQKKNALALERSVEALRRSNASLEEFARAASHDLKEPIRKILIFSDRLKHTLSAKMTEAEEQMFLRMEVAGQRMASLVDDLLDFSYVSFQPHEKEEVNLSDQLKKVMEDLEVLIDEKQAKINVHPLPVLMGYKRQLGQLFQNLVGNSLKYAKPDRVPEIDIKSTLIKGADHSGTIPVSESEKNFHLIVVTDNGIGFEQKDADRIFQMFQRLHVNTQFQGTGVGLAIARKVVENHNGFIWVTSEIQKGSTFYIALRV